MLPKTRLEIVAHDGDVHVRNGDLDAIDLSAKAKEDEGGGGGGGGGGDGERRVVAGVVEGPSSPTVRLEAERVSLVTALIPERYCGAQVRAQAGAVSVAKITEASLDVWAKKSVDLQSVKGIEVDVHSDAGDIGGVASGSNVCLRTKQGAIDMKKVVGNAVDVHSLGTVSMGSLYADVASVLSEERNVSLGNIGCKELVVRAEKGVVDIKGVTGNLEVAGCRRASIHLSKDCQKVQVRDVEEDIEITLEAGTSVKCKIDSASKEWTEDVREEAVVGQEEMDAVILSVPGMGLGMGLDTTAGNHRGESEVEPRQSELTVSAPNARVRISANSWLASMLMKKPSEKKK